MWRLTPKVVVLGGEAGPLRTDEVTTVVSFLSRGDPPHSCVRIQQEYKL